MAQVVAQVVVQTAQVAQVRAQVTQIVANVRAKMAAQICTGVMLWRYALTKKGL